MMNFTFWGAMYFCMAINIFKLSSGAQFTGMEANCSCFKDLLSGPMTALGVEQIHLNCQGLIRDFTPGPNTFMCLVGAVSPEPL